MGIAVARLEDGWMVVCRKEREKERERESEEERRVPWGSFRHLCRRQGGKEMSWEIHGRGAARQKVFVDTMSIVFASLTKRRAETMPF